MISEYDESLKFLTDSLTPNGFKLVHDSDYLSVFQSTQGAVILEGEPYVRGAFNLGISNSWPAHPRSIYSVRLLMKVFKEDAKASLVNQVQFLTSHLESLFCHPESYEVNYRQLNEG